MVKKMTFKCYLQVFKNTLDVKCLNVLGICVDDQVGGSPQALDVTVKYVKATAVDIASQTILVVHSDRETYAQNLAERLQNELSPKKIYISEVFPGCGANIGPGMVGVYYLGREILEGMETEKNIMKTLLGKN